MLFLRPILFTKSRPLNISRSVFCLLFACAACSQGGKKKPVARENDAVQYAVNQNPPLTPEEYAHFNVSSKNFFDRILPQRVFNGSILVAKNGQVVFEEYNGYTDPGLRKDTLTSSTAFHLASVSKTFTAMAILKLKEEGRLMLDDSLGKYFKDFPYRGLTIKMLLSHRSGLPNYLHYLESYKWDKRKMVTNTNVLRSLYDFHPPLDFPSGKHFAYCNTNYVLLALIIETVSGEPYATYLSNTFFKPLQMNDTYVWTPADMPRALPSFQYNNKKYPYEFLDVVYGDKNIYSTVRDMLKWDQALYPGNLFTKATLDSAFAGYSFEKDGQRNYGLGWRMTFLPNGKKLLYHNGWWHGNNTVFIRLVDEDAVIIVLSNKFNRNIYSAKRLANLFGDYEQSEEFEE